MGEKPVQYRAFSPLMKVLNIDWNKPTLPARADIVISFSLGSLLAINAVNSMKAHTLILCSPTPIIFDINKLKAKNIIVIYGEKEEGVRLYAYKLNREADNGVKSYEVPRAGHFMNQDYRDILLSVLESML